MLRLLFTVILAFIAPLLAQTNGPAELVFPMAELRLTNGTIFRNVTVVRWQKDMVVLKSAAGTGSLSYTMISEPLRAKFLAQRDVELAKRDADARQQRESAARADAAVQAATAKLAAQTEQRRIAVEAAIKRRGLVDGMTQAEVLKSRGAPIRRNTTGSGSTEQWIYEEQEGKYYVYFRDGILSSWDFTERKR